MIKLRPKLPANRTLLADLLNQQIKRLTALEREITNLMASLDERRQKR
ncbi:hypothetical protein [Sphingobium mellinum]